MTADVASEFLVLAMVGERDAAVGTTSDVTAVRALQRGRIAAAIEKENRLFTTFQAMSNGVDELRRKNGDDLSFAKGLAHVDYANERHFFVVGALGHFQQDVFSLFAVVKAFEGRRRRAKEDSRTFHLAAHDGDVASMITRSFFLLVAVFVFFIDDDEAERVDRREDG